MNLFRPLAAFAALFISSTALAVAPLAISFSAPNVSNLPLGVPVNIGVDLSGLGAGDSLDYVAATVSFNGALFNIPIVASGVVIPDSAAFVAQGQAGLVDASYDSLVSVSSAKVTQNGRLFSFSVTPTAGGSGTFALQFTDALGKLATGASIDGIAAGNSLPFAIVVPEPSTLLLTWMFAVALWSGIRRR